MSADEYAFSHDPENDAPPLLNAPEYVQFAHVRNVNGVFGTANRQLPEFWQHRYVGVHPQTANLRPVVHNFLPVSFSFGTG